MTISLFVSCSSEELILPTGTVEHASSSGLESRTVAETTVIDPILSTSNKVERIAFLEGLTPEAYPNSPDLETFIWDLEYYSNQDNFTGITKDRHMTIWSRLEIPLVVSDLGVSNATSQMITIRSSIESAVQDLLASVELADDDRWFEISSVFATEDDSIILLSIVIGGGTNLELCMQQGTCLEAVNVPTSVFTSITTCTPLMNDLQHNVLGCSSVNFPETMKFATEAVAIIDNGLVEPATRIPFSCNPISASQYYEHVRALNNIVIGPGQFSGDYPDPDSDYTTCTRDFLAYNASNCDTDCDQQDVRCISQADYSEYLLPNADKVIEADRLILGSDAKFFSYSIYDDVIFNCASNGNTYSIFLEAQYVYE